MRRLFVMSRTGGGWAASLRMALPALLMASGALACAGARVLDPRDAAAEFLRASSQGDSEAIYAVLSPAARATLSRGDVRRLVLDQKAELEAQAQALSSPRTRVTATARLRFADGETVALDWNGGKFGVTSGGALPGGSPTPEAALDELRRVIARRSYGGLLRLLSPATRSAIEQDLRTLVGGLEHPETLPIHTSGDASSAVVPGGHHVSMRREAGTWRVEDFD
jgi:hypothetical protein